MSSFNLNVEDGITSRNFKGYMLRWNNKYPIDRWWREKHEVAFMSKEHKAACLIDMRFEYEEDKFFRKLQKDRKRRAEDKKNAIDSGRTLKPQSTFTNEAFGDDDDFFDNLDVSELGDDTDTIDI